MMRRWVPGESDRGFALWLGVLTALALVMRAWNVSSQPFTGDDLGAALTAAHFVHMGQPSPTMWSHPPLRNLVLYASLSAIGPTPFALKLPALLFGTAAVALLGLVARRLLGSPRAALVAALLLALDPLHVDFSRQAVQETYMGCLALAGIWAALRYLDAQRWPWLVLSGVAFGLGVASKWYVLFPLAVTLGYVLFADLWAGRARNRAVARAFEVAALGLLPAIVYLLTYFPMFRRGYGLGDWLAFHASMISETVHHEGYNRPMLAAAFHPLWWFLRPTWFVDFGTSQGRPFVLVALPNPLVWLATIPAMVWLARRAWEERTRERLLPVAYFAAGYVPLLVANRPLWIHTALGLLPFAFIAIAWAVERAPRRLLLAYLAIVAVASAPLWFLATGGGLDSDVFRPLLYRLRPPGAP